MKKIIVAVLFWAFCIIGGCVVGTLCNPVSTHSVYPLTAHVVEVDRVTDVVTCEDGAGNLWKFKGCEDWEEDDFVSLLMNDNGTNETVYDDIIKMVRYSGTFEG